MEDTMSLRFRNWFGLSLVALGGLSGCGCEEEPVVEPTLAFFSPSPGSRLDLSVDKDNDPSNGLQVDLVLRAGNAEGATVDVDNESINNDSASATVTDGKVTFTDFTLVAPQGGATSSNNTIKASLTHNGKTVTVQANYTVITPAGPRCRFVDLTASTTLGASDDISNNAGMQYNVNVRCDGQGVEAGQAVGLIVTGAHQTVDGTLDNSGSVTFPEVNLPEGPVRLEASVTVDNQAQGTATVEFTVDTGACIVNVVAPRNGGPILAAADLDTDTPEVADVDLLINSTNCGPGSTASVSVLGQAGTTNGSLDGDSQATIRLQLPQGSQAFDIALTDGAGEKSEGRALRQYHVVDTVAPTLTLVRPAHQAILGVADDQDGDPVNGLQALVQLRLENGADVAGVQLSVNGNIQGGLVTANEFGVVETTLSLGSGEQTLGASATDEAGNLATITWTVTVDMVVPTVTMVAPAQDGTLLADSDHDQLTPGFQVLCRLNVDNFDAISGRNPKAYCEYRYADGEGAFSGAYVRSELVDLDAQGAASVAVTLTDGQLQLRAGVATENGTGNSAVSDPPRVLTVDGNPPTIGFLSPSDNAALQSTIVDLEIAVANAEAGQEITVTVNDVARVLDPAPVVVVGSSTFIQGFDLSDGQVADGSYVLGASVSDVGGNTATASPVTVSVDSAVPSVTVFGLDASEGNPERALDDGGTTLDAQLNPDLDWTGNTADGFQYAFRVEVANEAEGTQVSVSLNEGQPLTAATVSTGDPARLLADFTNDGNGILLPDGPNRLAVTVSDAAGNETVVQRSMTVVTGNSFVRILSPADGFRTNAAEVPVSGNSNLPEGSACELRASNGQTTVTANAAVDANDFLSWEPLALEVEGSWSLTVSCVLEGVPDPITTQSATTIVIDRTAPSLAFSGLPDGNVYNLAINADSTQGGAYRKNLTVSALADDGQTCTVDGLAPTATLATVGGNVDGQYNSSGFANCAFNFSNVALADEVNDADSSVQLTVTAADAAQNSGSAVITLVVDRVGPVVTFNNLDNGMVLGSDQDFDAVSENLQYRVRAEVTGFAPGSQATLFDNGDERVSVLAQGNLTFPPLTFTDGNHTIRLDAVDVNGNTGSAEASNITVDGSEPAIEIIRPIEGNVYNAGEDSNRGVPGYQVDITANLQGVENGATIFVFDANGDPNNNATAIGQGQVVGATIQIANITVEEGANTLTVSASDGINTATDSVQFTVDSTPPQLSLLAIAGDDGASSGGRLLLNAAEDGDNAAGWQGTFTFSLTGARVGSTYQVFTDFPQPQTLLAQGQVADEAAHSAAITLQEATQSLTVSASDAAGNPNDPGAGLGMIVDITAPTLSIGRPGNGALLLVSGQNNAVDEDLETPGMQYTFRASSDAEAGQEVAFTANGQPLQNIALEAGTAAGAVTLPEGEVTLGATVSDLVGNETTATSVTVSVDSIAPVVSIDQTPCDGTCADEDDTDADTGGLQVVVPVTATQVGNGRTISLVSSLGGERCTGTTNGGQVSLTCTLLEGADQSLTAVVSDASGNITTSAAVTVSVDLTAPSLAFTRPAANPARLNAGDDEDGAAGMQYTFNLSCDAAGRPVSLTVGGAAAIEENCDGASVSFSGVTVDEGTVSVSASISDAQNNTTQVAINAIVDTVAPTVEITDPANSPVTYVYDDDEVHENNAGDLRLDTSITVAVGGAAGGTLVVNSDQDGDVQTKAVAGDTDNVITDIRLTNQNHTLTVTATDANGNTATTQLVANVDVGKPDAMSLSSANVNNRAGTVDINWTEPGDDFDQGTVTSYSLRHSSASIDANNFGNATIINAEMTPAGAGQNLLVSVTGLPFDQQVFFAGQATDDLGNTSDIGTLSIDFSLTLSAYAASGVTGNTNKFAQRACSGDFNNDGRSDLVVTDRSFAPAGSQVGGAIIFMGADDLSNITPITRFGTASGGRFGSDCTAADFNGDGFDDLVVSAPRDGDGKIFIYNGSGAGLAANPSITITGTAGDRFGYSLSAGGSLVGDATVDLAASSWRHNSSTGKTWVWDGDILTQNRSDADAAVTVTGRPFSSTGTSLNAGRDVTGDGNGDLIIGGEEANGNVGELVVVPGPIADGAYTYQSAGVILLAGAGGSEGKTGFYLAVGDVAGDGTADILAGNGCCTRAISIWEGGPALGGARDHVITAPGGSSSFNEIDESSLCDIDGDGKMDLLTGSTNEGYVYFGNGITTLAKTYGVGTGLDANTSGAVHGVCLPDANLDGKPDLAFPVRSGGGYVNIRH